MQATHPIGRRWLQLRTELNKRYAGAHMMVACRQDQRCLASISHSVHVGVHELSKPPHHILQAALCGHMDSVVATIQRYI
jgi:hypothetical protein